MLARPAVVEDVDGIQSVWHQTPVADYLGGSSYRKDIKRWIREEGFFVTEEEGQVVSFSSLTQVIPHRLSMNFMGVSRYNRGEGHGEAHYFLNLVKGLLRGAFYLEDHIIPEDNPTMVLWQLTLGFNKNFVMREKTRGGTTNTVYTLPLYEDFWKTLPWVTDRLSRLEEYQLSETHRDQTLFEMNLQTARKYGLEERIVSNRNFARSLLNA